MKSMNLFSDAEAKSSEALFGDSKSKENTNQLPSAPFQDENGNLTFTLNTSEITTRDKDVCFSLEGRTYSLNVNSEEERKKVKKEVNANSLAKYDWFKEVIGKEHWVLYNTEMYEIAYDGFYCRYYLH